MNESDIKELVWNIARESAALGPGWAQEGAVLRAVGDRLFKGQSEPDLRSQQMVLDAWYGLFTENRLVWGFDLNNPGSPFFHVRRLQVAPTHG